MNAVERKKIISDVTNYYLSSRDFNGTHIKQLEANTQLEVTAVTAKQLITSGLIEFHFGHWVHPNPFIKAMDLGDKESQLKQLEEVIKWLPIFGIKIFRTMININQVRFFQKTWVIYFNLFLSFISKKLF